jgi:hypothetical protein
VTLTAKDSSGTQLTTGGSTVVFSLVGGTGATGSGTFGTVTDNGNGTYTATFTGTTVGSNTITATIDGTALTSTPASITITSAADPAQSTVTINPTSIQSGSPTTVTLTAKDTTGTQLTTGGSTVVFSLGNGTGQTGQGTFGAVTDNGNGTYTATFTGTIQGTNTITATIDGTALTSTAPTVTITPGPIDPSQTTVAVATSPIPNLGQTTVTLTAKDASGNQETTGGATVVFSLASGGTAAGTFSQVTDNGNGTYTATFTASTAGTSTIDALINTQQVTSTPPATITVTP